MPIVTSANGNLFAYFSSAPELYGTGKTKNEAISSLSELLYDHCNWLSLPYPCERDLAETKEKAVRKGNRILLPWETVPDNKTTATNGDTGGVFLQKHAGFFRHLPARDTGYFHPDGRRICRNSFAVSSFGIDRRNGRTCRRAMHGKHALRFTKGFFSAVFFGKGNCLGRTRNRHPRSRSFPVFPVRHRRKRGDTRMRNGRRKTLRKFRF